MSPVPEDGGYHPCRSGETLAAVGQIIVGQREPLEKMLIGMLCNGHVLLEGVPGIAKTMMVNSLAQALNVECNRIQFTPDLLPGDLVGTQIYRHETGVFETRRGPVFSNVVLADEINRSPARRTPCRSLSWCWPHKTPLNRRAPTRCRKRRSTGSCSSC